MIRIPPVGTLEKAVISGHAAEGFAVTTRKGEPLQMALVDEKGNIVELGEAVAVEAWNVAIATYSNFWQGQGHLRVYYDPPPNSLGWWRRQK